MKKSISILILVAASIISASAQRTTTSINDSWLFQKANESKKEIVSVPHCWNAVDGADEIPGYYRGKATYTKNIKLNDIENSSFYIHFEAVNQVAEVFINGNKAGKHIGGYTGFTFDITPYVKEGSNKIEVLADNTYDLDIAPLSADFTFMGGIYRDVEIIRTGKVHISTTDYATSGVYITTPSVSREKADVTITSHITNGIDGKAVLYICHDIISPSGKSIRNIKTKIKVKGADNDIIDNTSFTIENPELWSTENPALYHVVTTLLDKDGKVLDEVINRAGMRWFSFDPEKGFFLNGKHTKLLGTSRHQDYRNRGNALTDEIHVLDVLSLKQMGGNFLRISHYPQDPVITQMCDKLGILTSVEIPIVNEITESRAFQDNSMNMLREMIWQDYNSPSVVIWAYMNEVLLRPHFKKEPENYKRYLGVVHDYCKEINDECKKLDPYRYTMLPCNSNPDIYEEAGMTEIPDILGWNIYRGWYGSTIAEFKRFSKTLHERFPDKSMIVSEYGADMDIRLHSFKPERYDYTCEYGLLFHKGYLPEIKEKDYIAGGAVWNLNDFYSVNRTEGEPRVNNKGLADLDRNRKDVFLYYTAHFNTKPVVLIGGKSWVNRGGICDENGVSIQPLTIFSNAEKVSLTVNGKSLGTKTVTDCCADFEVPFIDGNNIIIAEANVEGKNVTDCASLPFKTYQDKITEDFDELNVFMGTKCYFDDKINHIAWIPEKEYSAGSWGYIGGKAARPKTSRGTVPCIDIDFLGTENDALYQCQRRGIEAFKADVPDGFYYIYLHLAEWTSNKKKEELIYALGGGVIAEESSDRVFDVVVNNNTALSDYDLANEAGAERAVVKKISVSVTGGQGLEIKFIPKKGETILNAIRIYKAY